MRLLHITHHYWPAIGGSEKYITDLSEELARRGHEIDVVTTRSKNHVTWANALPRAERREGVFVRRFDSLYRSQRITEIMLSGLRHYREARERRYEPEIFFGSGPISPGLFAFVRSQAKRYDAIHISQLHFSHAYTAFVAAKPSGRPIILTPHLHVEQPDTWDIGYLHTILKGSHVVVAVSEAEREQSVSHGLSASVVVAGNGLIMDNYPARDPLAARKALGLPEDAFVILFLGRKNDYKGLDVGIEAFRRIKDRHPKLVFLAIGPETPFSADLWNRVEPLDGLMRRGSVSETEKLDALAACDVMCMPSTGEAFGIVYLEGWAYSKPVIGARIRSVSSIITENETGLLINPGDSARLSELFSMLIENPSLGLAMGRRGRARLIRRYTIGRIAEIMEGAYAIARRRAAV